MNRSKSQELQNSNSKTYKKLLQSGALGTMVVGKTIQTLDAESLENNKFIRFNIISSKYGNDAIEFVEIKSGVIAEFIASSNSLGKIKIGSKDGEIFNASGRLTTFDCGPDKDGMIGLYDRMDGEEYKIKII